MNLLIDMNLAPRWVDWLAARGVVEVHWSAIGRADEPDVGIMDYARKNALVVLTHDLDFGAILSATNDSKPSVMQVRAEDNSPEAVGDAVVMAVRQLPLELQSGALVTILPDRRRIRILPLHHTP